MIKLELKEKSYGEKTIFKDISLMVNPGDILLIAGKSGIGKTTLLRIISGLDKDFVGNLKNTFSSQSMSFSQKVFLGRISAFMEIKVVSQASNDRIYKSLKHFDLWKSKDDLAKNLSTGQKTRLSLIRAFLADSEIIYLDEPLLGLDSENKRLAVEFINANLENRTLIYTGESLGLDNEKIYNLN